MTDEVIFPEGYPGAKLAGFTPKKLYDSSDVISFRLYSIAKSGYKTQENGNISNIFLRDITLTVRKRAEPH